MGSRESHPKCQYAYYLSVRVTASQFCHIRNMRLAWSLLVLLTPEARGQSWGLWPLYTPLLGDISPDCRAASQEYVQSLTSALQATASGAPLTEEHLTALAMFDSNGALPFLQEGRLADVYPVDLCDTLVPEPGANQACRSQVPAGVRTVTIPFGHSLGPGVESQCREARANYCYNYFQPFPPLTSTPHTVQSRSTSPTNLNIYKASFSTAKINGVKSTKAETTQEESNIHRFS